MNFKDIFKNSFLEAFMQNEVSASKVTVILLSTCIIALYIFLVYRMITRKTFYSKNFNISLAALSVITAIVILTVQSNIVLSLGMVGALSIVRFRTAIKDPMDLVFLFWAISVGIACGAGMLEIAIIGSFILTALIFFLDRLPMAKAAMILVISAQAGKDRTAQITELVKKYSKYYKVKSRNITGEQLDMVIELWASKEEELTEELSALSGIHSVSLMSHDGEVTF
ncbi:MAG: DUF4956 domain-containing protein [Lachnospiraceae bacterium]|nr:DUF4956 domain-containing protein [Lachnospiraceae bacterium]